MFVHWDGSDEAENKLRSILPPFKVKENGTISFKTRKPFKRHERAELGSYIVPLDNGDVEVVSPFVWSAVERSVKPSIPWDDPSDPDGGL